MTRSERAWRAAVGERFRGRRESLSAEVRRTCDGWGDIDRASAESALDSIEHLVGVAKSDLRPDDLLSELWRSVTARNPIQWLAFRTLERHVSDELLALITERMQASGTRKEWEARGGLRTVGDWVFAWNGRVPVDSKNGKEVG